MTKSDLAALKTLRELELFRNLSIEALIYECIQSTDIDEVQAVLDLFKLPKENKMRKARCKFYVTAVTPYGPTSKHIKLTTHYDTSVPEDQVYTKYTPSGNMDFMIDNPAIDDLFEVGKFFYVDLIPVEEE